MSPNKFLSIYFFCFLHSLHCYFSVVVVYFEGSAQNEMPFPNFPGSPVWALCEPWIRFQCKKLIIIHSSVVLGSRPGSLHGLSPIQYNHSPHTIQCLGESYLTARLFTSRRSSRPAATTPEESNKAVSRTLKSTFKVRGSLCRDLGTVFVLILWCFIF